MRAVIVVGVLATAGCFTDRAPARPPGPAPAPAPTAPAHAPPDPEAPLLPLDGTRVGTLPNGVTYMLAPRADKDATRAVVTLAIKGAGSLDETDPQAGAAHFLAHLVAPLIGADFDPDADARLTDSASTYTLRVTADGNAADDPAGDGDDEAGDDDDDDSTRTDDAKQRRAAHLARDARAIERDLASLRRAIDGSLSADAFALLRPELHATPPDDLRTAAIEHATRLGTHPVFAANAHYAHLALADVDAFRRAHYRSDAICVVIASAVDPAILTRAIAKQLGALPRPATPAPPRPVETPPPHRGLDVVLAPPDPRDSRPRVAHMQRAAHVEPRGERGRRAMLVDEVIARALDARRRIASPTATGIGSYQWPRATFAGGLDLIRIDEYGTDADTIELDTREIARLRRHGITADELAKILDELLAYADGARESYTDTEEHVDALAAHFTDGQEVHSPALVQVIERLARSITPADVAAAIARDFAIADRTLETDTTLWPPGRTPAQIAAALVAIDAAPIEPWDRRLATHPLIDPARLPVAPKRAITARQTVRSATIYTLANGMRVIAQPTTHSNGLARTAPDAIIGGDGIRISVVVPGGWARRDPATAAAARIGGQLLAFGGLGEQPGTVTRAIVGETVLQLEARVGAAASYVSVDGSDASAEVAFQAVFLALAAPRAADREALARWQDATRVTLAQISDDHRQALAALDAERGNAVAPPLDERAIAAVDPERAVAAYRDAVGDPAHAIAIVAGTFTAPQIEALIGRYLASIAPSGKRVGAPRPAAGVAMTAARALPPRVAMTAPPAIPPTVPPRVAMTAPPAIQPTVTLAPGEHRSLLVQYVGTGTGDRARDRRDVALLAYAFDDVLRHAIDDGAFHPSTSAGVGDDGTPWMRVTGDDVHRTIRAGDFADIDDELAALVAHGVLGNQMVGVLQRFGTLFESDVVEELVAVASTGPATAVLASAIATMTDPAKAELRITAPLLEATAKRFGRPRERVAFEPPLPP